MDAERSRSGTNKNPQATDSEGGQFVVLKPEKGGKKGQQIIDPESGQKMPTRTKRGTGKKRGKFWHPDEA